MARYVNTPGSATVAISEIASIDSRYTNRCLYTTPGCYTYTVPGGVTEILAVAVGPGSKPLEGLKCANMYIRGTVCGEMNNCFVNCCCNTCISSCCFPTCCGQANTSNCHIGGWKPVLIEREIAKTEVMCPFNACHKNCFFTSSPCIYCWSESCLNCLAEGEYNYEKAPGMGGGYSEKTIAVTPAQSVDLVVGCWNCTDSFSSVTANSTVSICATGARACRQSVPVITGPYFNGCKKMECCWEYILMNDAPNACNICGSTCKCCGNYKKQITCAGIWLYQNDFQMCVRPGCGFGGDINRIGGGTSTNICKMVTQDGDPRICGYGSGSLSSGLRHCATNQTYMHCGDAGDESCVGGNRSYESAMNCWAAGCYACGVNCAQQGGTYCSSPTAIATCKAEFIWMHPALASGGANWQFGRCQESGVGFLTGSCISCCQTHMSQSNKYCVNTRWRLSTLIRTSPSDVQNTCFGASVQCQGNTPGYLDVYSLCGAGCCPNCIMGCCISMLRFCKEDKVFMSAGSQYTGCCSCPDCGYRLYPSPRIKYLNSTVTDECMQFGGSSAGNYYANGVSSLSDATYNFDCSTAVNCRDTASAFCNLNENSAAYQFAAASAQGEFAQAVCTGTAHPCCWFCLLSDGCIDNFTLCNNCQLQANCNSCGCGIEGPYIPYYGNEPQYMFMPTTGTCGEFRNLPGSQSLNHKLPISVRGFETQCRPCAEDRFACCHAGDEVMCGYEFYSNWMCEDNFAIKQNLNFPYPHTHNPAYYHPFANPLNDLKGDPGRYIAGGFIWPNHCTSKYNYFCDGLCCKSCEMLCYRFFNNSCNCMKQSCCSGFMPHPCSCYKYYSANSSHNIIYSGNAIDSFGGDCQSCHMNPHNLNTIVSMMKLNSACNSRNPTCMMTCMWCDSSSVCWGGSGEGPNQSNNCFLWRNVFCENFGTNVNGSRVCVNRYWPYCLGYNALTANTENAKHNCGNITCGLNMNPTISVYDYICFMQDYKGLDDKGKPCAGWASAAYDCNTTNTQVYLATSNNHICKPIMGPHWLPFSHRIIPFMTRGHCEWTLACYTSNNAVCAFRSPDKVTICDPDYYYQFVYTPNLNYSHCGCMCHCSYCQCCACCFQIMCFQQNSCACMTRTVGSTCTDLDTTTAQGGAGTATPGVWNSCCGGSGGVITRVDVTCSGSGYTTCPYICVCGGGGSGAVVRPIMHFTTQDVFCCQSTTGMDFERVVCGGCVTGVEIVSPGSEYTTAPTLCFNGGGGTSALATATVSDFVANKSFGSGGGTIDGTLYTTKCVDVTDSAAVQKVVIGRGGRGCEPEASPYFNSYPGISTTITQPTDPSAFEGDVATGCSWFDTKQIRGSGGNGCFTSGVFGLVAAQNPGPGGGGAVGCDSLGNLIGCGGVLAGGSGCCGNGGIGGGAGRCGTPGNGMVVIYWNA